MNNKFNELVNYINENKVYINASEFNQHEYILMAFRHATTETNLELFFLSFNLIKEINLTLGDNEYYMFEWLIDRQLTNKGNNAIKLLDFYLSEAYFSKDNIYTNIGEAFFKQINYLSERKMFNYIEPILSNKSIVNYLFNYDKKEFLDICNSHTKLHKFKTIFTVSNF